MRQANETPEGTPAPEIVETRATRVACDGGCGALGHPRVWLTIDPGRGWVDCGYCDRRFVLARGPAAALLGGAGATGDATGGAAGNATGAAPGSATGAAPGSATGAAPGVEPAPGLPPHASPGPGA